MKNFVLRNTHEIIAKVIEYIFLNLFMNFYPLEPDLEKVSQQYALATDH